MKIIHTADWHLCDRLGRIDRTPDLQARVARVAELCELHDVDVLLIAGDLFSEQAQVEQMTDALRFISKTFAPFFARGGSILGITGNHDRDGKINIVRAGMSLAAPAGPGAHLPGGRMHLINGRHLLTLTGKTGQRVQFVLVPYPFAHRYDLDPTTYRSRDEEHQQLHHMGAEWVKNIANDEKFDPTLPTVLAAHLAVRGSDLGGMSRYVLTDRDDVIFEFADLNPGWAYAALGHIHKPQTISGLAHVRYSGSLDRLDFGETHDGHGVWLIEVGPSGLVREPEHLPIAATPFHSLVITDPEAELPTLRDRYPDRDTSLFRATITPPKSGISRDEILRVMNRTFRNLHQLTWAEQETAETKATLSFTPRDSLEATVRDYLARELEGEPDRAAVLELAEEFLKVKVAS